MKYNFLFFTTKDKDLLSFEFLFGVELHFNPNFKQANWIWCGIWTFWEIWND